MLHGTPLPSAWPKLARAAIVQLAGLAHVHVAAHEVFADLDAVVAHIAEAARRAGEARLVR